MKQSGTLGIMIQKSTQQLPKSFSVPDGQVLGGRQLGLVFFFFTSILFGTVALLGLELLVTKAGKMAKNPPRILAVDAWIQ